MGENAAIMKFLTFGLLGERCPWVRCFGVLDQSYWLAATDWLFQRHKDNVSRLTGKIHMWTKCQQGKVSISNFTNVTVAKKAYIATGSVYPPTDIIENKATSCTDGGVGSTFRDGLHVQITVSPATAMGHLSALFGYTA